MSRRLLIFVTILTLLGPAAIAAQAPDPQAGYRETTLFSDGVTIETPGGPKKFQITIRKIRAVGGQSVRIELPERGMAIFQHRAGDLAVRVGGTRFEPLEGQWMTVDLPEVVIFDTEDDSVIVDAIIISE